MNDRTEEKVKAESRAAVKDQALVAEKASDTKKRDKKQVAQASVGKPVKTASCGFVASRFNSGMPEKYTLPTLSPTPTFSPLMGKDGKPICPPIFKYKSPYVLAKYSSSDISSSSASSSSFNLIDAVFDEIKWRPSPPSSYADVIKVKSADSNKKAAAAAAAQTSHDDSSINDSLAELEDDVALLGSAAVVTPDTRAPPQSDSNTSVSLSQDEESEIQVMRTASMLAQAAVDESSAEMRSEVDRKLAAMLQETLGKIRKPVSSGGKDGRILGSGSSIPFVSSVRSRSRQSSSSDDDFPQNDSSHCSQTSDIFDTSSGESLPEEESAPEKNLVPEEEFAPEKKLVPEEESAPEKKLVPEKESAPEKNLVPEEEFAPEKKLVPEKESAPEKKLVPEEESAPEKKLVPE